MKNNEFMNKYGLFATIVVTVVGVGVFSYPSMVTNKAGSDGWIVTLVAGGIGCFLLYLIYKVAKQNNFIDFYDILNNNLGHFFAKIFGILMCVYFMTAVSLGMRTFVEVIKMYLLEQTPTEFILVITIFTGLYLVRGEAAAVIKFNEVVFWLMFIPAIFILMLASKGSDFTNILPILKGHSIKDYGSSLLSATYAFGGFEIAYLAMPYLKNKKGIPKVLMGSMAFITIFYVLVTILCLAFFGKEHTASLLWPTITLIRAISIPGAFIERWEGVVMALWVLFYFTTFVNIFFFSSHILKKAFNLGDVKISSYIIVPFIYIIALFPQNIAELYDLLSKTTPLFSLFSFLFLPLILLILGWIRRRRREKNEI